MLSILEVSERGYSGPRMTKDDFDVEEIVMKVAELVDEYDLTWDRDELIVTDAAKLDRFFLAGRALLVSAGVYNQSTGRVIRFSEAEIDAAASSAPRTLKMGSGADAVELFARKAEDVRRPLVTAGNPGCPMTPHEFAGTVESWAREPGIDLLTCGSIVEIDGHPVRNSEPSEVLAVRHELETLNRICREVGRPFMGRLAGESSVSDTGDLASMAEGLIRPGDAHLVALNNELITNRDNLVRAANAVGSRVKNASLACVMVEGLAGNAAGAALTMIASMLAARVLYGADYHLCHPIHLRHIATGAPGCLFVQSVTCQAFERNAPAIIVGDIYPRSGAGTKELLYEVAASSLLLTVSGGHLEGVGSCDGLKPHCSPLEVRLMADVGRKVTELGLTRRDAMPLLASLVSRYEGILAGGNEGQHFDAVYDREAGRAKPFWQNMYEEVLQDLSTLGLCL